ncbi:MAG TPA: GlsB/YeaQ/YmgE family stress response membrane protein [Anaerolineales bacterium]
MTIEAFLIWIIVGAIAGFLADAVVRGIRIGLAGAIIIGIIGGLIGGWLFNVLDISIGAGIVGDIITAFIGAVILLLLIRGIRR